MCGLVPLRIHHVPITHVEGFALFPAFIFLVGLQKKADCPISVSAQIHHLFFYEIEEHVRPIINIIHLIQRQWCAQLGNIILAPYQSSVQVGHTKGGHTKKGPQVLHWLLECLTAACKALSLANAKGKGTNGLVIGSLD